MQHCVLVANVSVRKREENKRKIIEKKTTKRQQEQQLLQQYIQKCDRRRLSLSFPRLLLSRARGTANWSLFSSRHSFKHTRTLLFFHLLYKRKYLPAKYNLYKLYNTMHVTFGYVPYFFRSSFAANVLYFSTCFA